MARLTIYLEDGKKAGKHEELDQFANCVKNFISKEYMPKPQSKPRNEIILFVNEQLPGLSQRRLAEVCGTDVSTVNRVLKGEDTGGGNRGHGGARK